MSFLCHLLEETTQTQPNVDKSQCIDEYLWAVHGLLVARKKYCDYTCVNQLLSRCLSRIP